MLETDVRESLNLALENIRGAVRRQKAYQVGGFENPPVKLNQNESPFDFPADLKEELLDTFRKIPFNRYPSEQPIRLAQAYAQYAGHVAEGVLVGNGSNELTYTLGLCVVERGRPVVLPRPMFALYTTMVRLFEGDLESIPPRSDLRFDTEAILEAVRRRRPMLTVLTTPNNPTGLAMTLEEVEAIAEAASPGLLIVDEAYVEFNSEGSAMGLLPSYPNVIILRTLSKAAGLAGLRIGFMLAHPDLISEILKARLPFMVDPLAETAAAVLLKRPSLLRDRAAQIRESCRALTASMQEMNGVDVLPSQANFVLFKTRLSSEEVMNRLKGSGVLVRNMAGYPELKDFVRVNAGTPSENNAFLVALKNALARPP